MSKGEPIVSGGIGLIARAYAFEKRTGYRPRFGERGKFPKEDRRKTSELYVDENTKIARGCVEHGSSLLASNALNVFQLGKYF